MIKTKSRVFGRVQVTLSVQVKRSMIVWANKSGMRKAEFLRTALMIGDAQLAEDVKAKSPEEGYCKGGLEDLQATA
jgi:hypothetical protein